VVTLVYKPGKGVPDHLRAAFRLKNHVFNAGESVTVTPDRAAMALASAPAGSMSVVDGTPSKPAPALNNSVKQSQKALAERAILFSEDPARALGGLPQLSTEAVKSLLGRTAVKSIRNGDHDEYLEIAAIFAYMAGHTAAADAAARRAATLQRDAARG
jgi:hypothetical protein